MSSRHAKLSMSLTVNRRLDIVATAASKSANGY